MPVTETTTGIQKQAAKLKRLSLAKMTGIIEARYKKNIRQSLNADGSAMDPLKPQTILAKQKLGARFPKRPLSRTEQLLNATESRRLDKSSRIVFVQDKVRGNTTNTGILDYQKKRNRQPWGIGKTLVSELSAYSKSVFEPE